MLFHCPAIYHLPRFGVDDRHRGLAPQAHVKALPFLIQNATVRKWFVSPGWVENGFSTLENSDFVGIRRRAGVRLDVVGLNDEGVWAEWQFATNFLLQQAHARNALRPNIGHVEVLSISGQSNPRGNAAPLFLAQPDLPMI